MCHHSASSFSKICFTVSSDCGSGILGQFLQFQQQRVMLGRRDRSSPWSSSNRCVPPSEINGNRWLSSLAVVVVQVRGADAVLHDLERRRPRLRSCWRGRHRSRSPASDASVSRKYIRRSALESSLGMFSSSTSTPRWRANRLISSSAVKAASTLRSSNSSPPKRPGAGSDSGTESSRRSRARA